MADGEILPPGLPALIAPSPNLREVHADFTRGSDGTRASFEREFRSIGNAFGIMGPGVTHGATNGFVAANRLAEHRDGPISASVAKAMVHRFPELAAIIEAIVVSCLGTGLVLSSKINAEAIGCTPEQAQALSREIERKWGLWCANPVECDHAGRSTLHQLAHSGLRSYLLAGEILAMQNVRRVRGARTRLKVAMLDHSQLDWTRNNSGDGFSIYAGVHFFASGEIAGYWVREMVPGSQAINILPKFVHARNSFGRRNILHIFDFAAPGQVRGVSPLTSALSTILEVSQLREYTLEAARLQTAYAMYIKTADQFAAHGMSPQDRDPRREAALRAEFYELNPFDPKPGTASMLAPSDDLKMIRSETPNSNYHKFNADLVRIASKAAGANPEHVSGDYSVANFASARLAEEVPYRETLRRREAILVPFYHGTFRNWLEEQFETEQIKLPPGAPTFLQAADDYTQAKWMGPGRIVADPLKATNNSVLRVANHLSTLADELAEDGRDLETTLRERAEEIALAKSLGLSPGTPGTVSTVHRDNEEVPPGPERD